MEYKSLLPLPGLLLDWYGQKARVLPWRQCPTPYFVLVSEIMLQQTRVEAVKPYFERFTAALPDFQALAEAPEDKLLKLWEGLGYYRRARNLQRAARLVLTDYGGRLPQTKQELAKLPGVGSYTAGAVASIAYGQRVAAVDGNVMRVLSRFLAMREDVTSPGARRCAEQGLETVMPDRAGDFNQALMELGALVCLPHGAPLCQQCPLSGLCQAHLAGQASLYPVKAAKKPRRREEKTVFLLLRQGKVALARRPAQGILAGMWELPNCPAGQEAEALAQWGIEGGRSAALGPAKHLFTHVEWHMQGWAVWIERAGALETWVTPAELKESYALPSAFRPYASLLGGLINEESCPLRPEGVRGK